MDYGPRGHTESDTTELLTLSLLDEGTGAK